METDGFGEFADIFFITGEKVPAVLGNSAGVFDVVISFEVLDFFLCGECRSFVGIEADGPDVIIVADGLRNGFDGAEEVVKDERAEHGTFEIDEGEDDRLAVGLALELSEGDRVAVFVVERDIGGNGLAEVLGDADVLEKGGGGLGASREWVCESESQKAQDDKVAR